MLKMSAFYLDKQKSFIPKKICGLLITETLKSKISDFLNNNTCFCSRLSGIFSMIFKVMSKFFFIRPLILNALYDEMLLTQKMLNKVSFLIYIALHLSFEGNIKEKHCMYNTHPSKAFSKKKRLKENIYTTALYIPVNAH